MKSSAGPAAIGISIVSLIVSICSATISTCSYLQTKKYQEFEYQPQLAISEERPSYVHPKLDVKGSPEFDYLIKNRVAPRWFSYSAKLKNLGSRPVHLVALNLCVRFPEQEGCPDSFSLGGSLIGAGETRRIAFESADGQGPHNLFTDKDIGIFLRAEVEFPGDTVKVWERKIGGFTDGMPLMVREGTVIPEGSAMAVELHFKAPR